MLHLSAGVSCLAGTFWEKAISNPQKWISFRQVAIETKCWHFLRGRWEMPCILQRRAHCRLPSMPQIVPKHVERIFIAVVHLFGEVILCRKFVCSRFEGKHGHRSVDRQERCSDCCLVLTDFLQSSSNSRTYSDAPPCLLSPNRWPSEAIVSSISSSGISSCMVGGFRKCTCP